MDRHVANKKLVREVYRRLETVADTRSVLADACDAGTVWCCAQPLNELRGPEEVAARLFAQLGVAMPDVETRIDLLFAGRFDDRDWVTVVGHVGRHVRAASARRAADRRRRVPAFRRLPRAGVRAHRRHLPDLRPDGPDAPGGDLAMAAEHGGRVPGAGANDRRRRADGRGRSGPQRHQPRLGRGDDLRPGPLRR
ncbi:MAG: hypothetical protein HC871_15450 [Rhizobiales bacterium]|nr:hypothetical protein [Hyphomicrobiales bacterium]